MIKIQITPEITNALKLYSHAVGAALEDEGIDQATRDRIARRVTSMMNDVIDDGWLCDLPNTTKTEAEVFDPCDPMSRLYEDEAPDWSND